MADRTRLVAGVAAIAVAAVVVVLVAACTGTVPDTGGDTEAQPVAPDPQGTDMAAPDTDDAGLRSLVPDRLRIGTAVAGGGHHDFPGVNRDPFREDATYLEVLAREFDSVTPENWLKWDTLRPSPDTYDFGPADEVVAFAEDHGQVVRGHALVWHSQNPGWLNETAYTPDELREILRDHIHTVVGHYRGRISHWDVVNEAFEEDGELRDTIWLRALGPDYVADAFRWAHEADPDAELFLNDYNVEAINAKSDAYYELVQDLLADGVPVHGFGVQAHLSTAYDFPRSLEPNLRRFDELGLATAVTEADVRIPLAGDGAPTDEQLVQQAGLFRRLLDACLAVDGCRSFTVWGFSDDHSWVPSFFAGEGAPSIMWGDYTPKPAYDAIHDGLEVAAGGR